MTDASLLLSLHFIRSAAMRRRKPERYCNLLGLFWCLLAPCCLFVACFLFSTDAGISARPSEERREVDLLKGQRQSPFNISKELNGASVIPLHSLTVILPVTRQSFPRFAEILAPFLEHSPHVKEVLLVCSDALVSEIRHLLRNVVKTGSHNSPDISLRPWAEALNLDLGLLRNAGDTSTDWVLVLNETGFESVDECTRHMLLHPARLSVPSGPRGVGLPPSHHSHVIVNEARVASFLTPPFVMPSKLVPKRLGLASHDVWPSFGRLVSIARNDEVAGILLNTTGAESGHVEWCTYGHTFPFSQSDPCGWKPRPHVPGPGPPLASKTVLRKKTSLALFVIFLPDQKDLNLFSVLLCGLQDKGHHIRVIVCDGTCAGRIDLDWEERIISMDHCILTYHTLVEDGLFLIDFGESSTLQEWLNANQGPDVMLALKEEERIDGLLEPQRGSVLIRIPRTDLPNCAWMASLSLTEWKSSNYYLLIGRMTYSLRLTDWNVPRIDISVITKDRPQSLTRLLGSLSHARYFGDQLALRVNLEQDCDVETMKIVEELSWPHGVTFIHHRVIHGGLLPAVVESWYPHTNDTYGLLLEDDIELSPLFYAWIKMNILRYRYAAYYLSALAFIIFFRYGDISNRSPFLFGVSLYQQKHVELPSDGRKPFNAQTLFSKHGIPYNSPYLSQVPCSWGAVYFPEHWREFHDYLALRFSEALTGIAENIVVPDVRSNHWAKSWKRYFIELTFLRGYVMVYPNYDDFVALSTNHLEAGEHVRVRTRERQELFQVPLMPLIAGGQGEGLLALPGGTLPEWRQLPVLNLTGSLTNLAALVSVGNSRLGELARCDKELGLYMIQDLTCTNIIV